MGLLNMKNKHVPEFIVIVIVLVAGLGVLTFNQVSSKHSKANQQTESVKIHKVKKATFTGSWSGYTKYPKGQRVTIKVKFIDSKKYSLIETNTVSQVWQRSYTGTYKINDGVATLTPSNVEVNTFASENALKADEVTNSESVVKSDFYRQFGNEQTGKVKIKNSNLIIQHDHEKIKLHAVK